MGVQTAHKGKPGDWPPECQRRSPCFALCPFPDVLAVGSLAYLASLQLHSWIKGKESNFISYFFVLVCTEAKNTYGILYPICLELKELCFNSETIMVGERKVHMWHRDIDMEVWSWTWVCLNLTQRISLSREEGTLSKCWCSLFMTESDIYYHGWDEGINLIICFPLHHM